MLKPSGDRFDVASPDMAMFGSKRYRGRPTSFSPMTLSPVAPTPSLQLPDPEMMLHRQAPLPAQAEALSPGISPGLTGGFSSFEEPDGPDLSLSTRQLPPLNHGC
jgi:hypothetical protein